jgi:hypothetical protein
MELITGELKKSGVNSEDIEAGYQLLNQAAFELNPSV